MSTRIHLLLTVLFVLPLAFASCADTTDVEEPTNTAETADVVGDVRFETSCAEEIQGAFDTAVATLHSFEFDEARGMFEAIRVREPRLCSGCMGCGHDVLSPPVGAAHGGRAQVGCGSGGESKEHGDDGAGGALHRGDWSFFR